MPPFCFVLFLFFYIVFAFVNNVFNLLPTLSLCLSLRSSLFFNLHWHCINIWTSCQAGERQQLLRLQLLLLLLRWFMQWRTEKGIRPHLMLILRLFALSRRGVDPGEQGKGATRVAHCLCKCFFNNCMPQLADPPEINVTHVCVCVGKRVSNFVCVCANVR